MFAIPSSSVQSLGNSSARAHFAVTPIASTAWRDSQSQSENMPKSRDSADLPQATPHSLGLPSPLLNGDNILLLQEQDGRQSAEAEQTSSSLGQIVRQFTDIATND